MTLKDNVLHIKRSKDQGVHHTSDGVGGIKSIDTAALCSMF